MPQIECLVEETPDGVTATCGDCNHCVEIEGVRLNEDTTRRLLAEMRRTCKMKEKNHYVPVE